MSSELLAGLLIGFIAALPYLAFVVAGLFGLLRGEGLPGALGTAKVSGAAFGAILAGLTLAYLIFFLIRVTGLSTLPSPIWWGVGVGLPALVAGWVGFLGIAQDDRKLSFRYLLVGLFLSIFGFCGLPVGLVVFLAGLIFGSRGGTSPLP